MKKITLSIANIIGILCVFALAATSYAEISCSHHLFPSIILTPTCLPTPSVARIQTPTPIITQEMTPTITPEITVIIQPNSRVSASPTPSPKKVPTETIIPLETPFPNQPFGK